MRGEPTLGAARVFINPKLLRSPMKPLAVVGEKAREYPQRYHWTLVTDRQPIQARIMWRADLRRTRPAYRKPRPGTMIHTKADATMR